MPPYAFAAVDALKQELRREGRDVVDLGFGNPDIASPTIAVEKLREAAGKARNHRYSASRGIPKLREAICDLFRRRFGVELDPETQALTTIGAKEGLTHLMWVLLEPGDTAVVPTPICHDNYVYVSSGYGAGCNLFKVTKADGKFSAEEVYSNKAMVDHHGGVPPDDVGVRSLERHRTGVVCGDPLYLCR